MAAFKKQVNWKDMQEKAFTKWTNEQLKAKGRQIDSFRDGFRDGLNLIALIEVCTQDTVKRYNRNPKIDVQKLENCGIAMKMIADHDIKLENIGNEDIFNGNIKLICGLVWTLILKYHIQGGKLGLLAWVNDRIGANTPYNMPIKNFTTDWNDGRAVCALTDALAPGRCANAKDLDGSNALENARLGMGLAEEELGICKIIMPAEMVHPKVDELAMMAYISQFQEATPKAPSDASVSRAYGQGLVEGVMGEAAEFIVETPKDEAGETPGTPSAIVVRVVGPSGNETAAEMTRQPFQRGDKGAKTKVVYTPTEHGDHQVFVEVNGKEIPGSAFQVLILEEATLGGEGKIRVYYSTTSGTEKQRSDQNKLQNFLEMKKIHLRPDFEPWIPVDIMDPRDRNLVFTKAGSKTLPIVFIDEKYVGDYDKCMELNEDGELDKLLRMDKFNQK